MEAWGKKISPWQRSRLPCHIRRELSPSRAGRALLLRDTPTWAVLRNRTSAALVLTRPLHSEMLDNEWVQALMYVVRTNISVTAHYGMIIPIYLYTTSLCIPIQDIVADLLHLLYLQIWYIVVEGDTSVGTDMEYSGGPTRNKEAKPLTTYVTAPTILCTQLLSSESLVTLNCAMHVGGRRYCATCRTRQTKGCLFHATCLMQQSQHILLDISRQLACMKLGTREKYQPIQYCWVHTSRLLGYLVYTCHLPIYIQQICCSTQTGQCLRLQCSCCPVWVLQPIHIHSATLHVSCEIRQLYCV